MSELHAAIQDFPVGQAHPAPAFKHLVDPKTFGSSKLLIAEVCVMDNLRHHTNLAVPNAKGLLQGFEGAVIAPVAKATVVHIVRNGIPGHLILRGKYETCLGIDKAADQPRGSYAVDARAGPCNPEACAIVFARDLSWLLGSRGRLIAVLQVVKHCFDALAAWGVKEVNGYNFLKALAKPSEPRGRTIW